MPTSSVSIAPLAAFGLDPAIVHLNHGSFGACPRAVLHAQARLRARLEAAPTRFFLRDWPGLLAEARQRVAAFVGADAAGLVFVANTTSAVSTVLAGHGLGPGDEIVVTDHGYRACCNAADRVAAATGARVVVATLPFPVPAAGAGAGADPVVAAIERVLGPRTRLILIDHVTSPTALVLPVAAIAAVAAARGIDVLVDGAHAPGMLDVDIAGLGVTYYVGNCHKWIAAPKSSALLWAHPDRRDRIRPLVTSHGASMADDDGGRYHGEHDWTGTHDPSPYLTVPDALDAMASLGGGWPAVRAANHALAVAGRDLLLDALGADPIAPVERLGSMATVPITLPAGLTTAALEGRLLDDGFEAPVVPWSTPLIRISAQLYNKLDDVDRLATYLRSLGVSGARFA